MSENWQSWCSGSNLTVGGKWNFTLNQRATRSHRRVPYCYVLTILSSSLFLSSSIIFSSGLDQLLFYEDSLASADGPLYRLFQCADCFQKESTIVSSFSFFFSFLLFDVLLFTDSSVSNVRLLRVYEIVNESFRKEMHEILTFSENRETPCSLTSCKTVARWSFLKLFQFLLLVVYVLRNSSTKWWYKSFFPVVIRITGMVRATMISKLFSTWVVRGFWKSIFPFWRQLTRIFSTST